VSFLLDWDWTDAEAALRRAIELDPSYALAHRRLAVVLSQIGRHNEAATQMHRARALDPLEPMQHALSSQVTFQARDHSAAVEHARRAIALDQEFWIAYVQIGTGI
jgi:tetratricopeptide (TPR) repeat protein